MKFSKPILRNTLIIILVVVLAMIVRFAFSLYSASKIESFSEKVFTEILNGDGQMVWENSTEDFKSVINQEYGGLEKFDHTLFMAAKSFENITSWEIVDVMNFGDAATIEIVMMHPESYNNHRYFLYLKKEEGKWKLNRPRVMDH